MLSRMAFSQTQLDALEKAIATGELTVTYEGKSVTYRSVRELKEARDLVLSQLEAAGEVSPSTRVSYASRSRD
jgi:hypothetical protein